MKSDIKITAKTGTYVGIQENGISEFLGIRYAQPVGFWEYPKELETTQADEILAKDYGPACLQPRTPDELASLGPTSNDCLTLNIWTKSTATKGKPVMVYIHGGSYVNGGNHDPVTYGKNFIEMLPQKEDAVLVKINYRLGIFGCMDLSVLEDYDEKYEHSTVLHLIDQIFALKWIHENIAAFGGNPENVTLFGQSAGSMSIAYLMANDTARKYFNRAIMQSGIPSFGIATKEKKAAMSKGIFERLGIKSIKDLQGKDDDFWKENYENIFQEFAGVICPRVADGVYITDHFWQDIEEGKAKEISLMVGATTGEMDMYQWSMTESGRENLNSPERILDMLYAMYEDSGLPIGNLSPWGHDSIIETYMSKPGDKTKRALNIYAAFATQLGSMYYADAQSKWNEQTYLYAWNWMPDGTKLSKSGERTAFSPWNRAVHCAELPVLFNSGSTAYPALSTWWLHYIGEDLKTSVPDALIPEDLIKKSVLTWYCFAKNGDPNNALIPQWVPYEQEHKMTMVIDQEWASMPDALLEDADILYHIKPRTKQDDTLQNSRQKAANIHTMER